MATRTEFAPGTFSWVDLTSRDIAGVKGFYGELLGWEFEDNDVPGGGMYSMCKVGDDSVAALAPQNDEFPPHWNSYVTVASADDTAAKAKALGANVIEEPFDVIEAGRMALLQDPTGAALCTWEPRDMVGAGRVNEPGCLTWNELHTPDPDRAVEFYTGLFGWGTHEMDTQGGPSYTVVKVGERSNGGVMDTQEGEPPNWLPYFVVESRDGAAEQAKQIGATELFRMDMPQGGKIAAFSDPQGAPFAVWEGDVDDYGRRLPADRRDKHIRRRRGGRARRVGGGNRPRWLNEPARRPYPDSTICKPHGARAHADGHHRRRLTHQGTSRPSRKNPPLGPSSGRVAAHTTLAAPCSTGCPPGPPMSVATHPGHTELTRTRRRSSPASRRVRAFSEALLTLYAGVPPLMLASEPPSLDTLTIRA